MIKSQDSGLSRTCCLVAHDCGDDVTSGKKDISIYLKTRLFGILLKAEKKNKPELQFTEDCKRKFEENPSVEYIGGTYLVLGSNNLSHGSL